MSVSLDSDAGHGRVGRSPRGDSLGDDTSRRMARRHSGCGTHRGMSGNVNGMAERGAADPGARLPLASAAGAPLDRATRRAILREVEGPSGS